MVANFESFQVMDAARNASKELLTVFQETVDDVKKKVGGSNDEMKALKERMGAMDIQMKNLKERTEVVDQFNKRM